jgi:hypothetical protein
MGIFGSKKKIYVGVSNSEMIPDEDAPQAIKDSTYSYIMDYAQANGDPGDDMVGYINDGMDKSIVRGVKRLNRWIAKDLYDVVGSIEGTMDTVSDADVQDLVATHIESLYPNEVTFYYLNNFDLDLSHLVRQVLIDRRGYDPSDNSFIHSGNKLYLENAYITTTDSSEVLSDFIGPSFESGYTPYRAEDLTVPFTAANLTYDNTMQFDFFDATGVNSLSIDTIESITQTVVDTYDPATDTTTTTTSEESTGTETVNNIPISGLVSQEYLETVNYSEVLSSTQTVDGDVTTTVNEIEYITQEFYKCSYSIRDTFEDYFDSRNIDWDSLTTEETIAMIDEVNEPDIRILVGYEHTSDEGVRTVVYQTLTESDTYYVEDVGESVAFGNFMPHLYFKRDFEYGHEDKTTDEYIQSKKYAKKLNLVYKDLCDEIQEATEDDDDTIKYAYLKFGVEFHSEKEDEKQYIFNFCAKYFQFCDTDNKYGFDYPYQPNVPVGVMGKQLNFKDKVIKYNMNMSYISYIEGESTAEEEGTYTRGSGEIPFVEPEPGSTSGSFYISAWAEAIHNKYFKDYNYIRLQDTPTTYKEYRVFRLTSDIYVGSGKWAESGQDSTLLMPLDFDVVDSLKGFRSKERFLYSCMWVEFLTYKVVKVKWYQRGVIKLIVFAISVAVSVFLGPGGATINSVLTAVVTSYAVGLAIDFSIKILAKFLSPDLMKLLALAIIATGLIMGNMNAISKSTGYFSKAFTILAMKADLLVSIGVKIVNMANQQAIADIYDEFLNQKDIYDEKMEELEDYKAENLVYRAQRVTYLDEDIRYEPPMIGETVYDMIDRSLNSNPALIAINYVYGYVDYILTLPTVSETLYKPIKDVN